MSQDLGPDKQTPVNCDINWPQWTIKQLKIEKYFMMTQFLSLNEIIASVIKKQLCLSWPSDGWVSGYPSPVLTNHLFQIVCQFVKRTFYT